MDKRTTYYGYSLREPFESERRYFYSNPNVGGMATEDKKIILNPYKTFTDVEKQSVIKNEALRLWMKDRNIVPNFELTPEQKQKFKGTPYEKDDLALKQSILSRFLSGDPSAGILTKEQESWANKILEELKNPEKMNQRQFEEWRMWDE